MTCEQEMCPYWAGDGGCPCAMFDIDIEARKFSHIFSEGDVEDG